MKLTDETFSILLQSTLYSLLTHDWWLSQPTYWRLFQLRCWCSTQT